MITNFKIFEYSIADHLGVPRTQFKDDDYLPPGIFLNSVDKKVRVKWNVTIKHDMVERMVRYRKVGSVKDYLRLITKAFDEVIPYIYEKDKTYCIHLTDRKLYIFFKYNDVKGGKGKYDQSRDVEAPIYIISIYPNPPEYYDFMYDVDDSFYLI